MHTLTDELQGKETELDQAQLERDMLKKHIESLEKIERDHVGNLRKFEQENFELQFKL